MWRNTHTHRSVQERLLLSLLHNISLFPPFLSCLSLFPRNLWFPPPSTQTLPLPQAWLISPLAFFKQVAHVWQRPPTHTRSHHSSIPSLSPGKTLNPLTRSLIQPQASRRAQKALGRMAVDSSVCLSVTSRYAWCLNGIYACRALLSFCHCLCLFFVWTRLDCYLLRLFR